LVSRYARTHGPFTTAAVATRFGLGLRVAADVLGRLAADRKLDPGEFVDAAVDSPGSEQWCDSEVLRILRRRSLAALRAQVEPVDTAAYGRFVPPGSRSAPRRPPGSTDWPLSSNNSPACRCRPVRSNPGVRPAGGRLLPGDARRTAGLRGGHLVGRGSISVGASGTTDGWVAFHPADTAPLTLGAPLDLDLTDVHREILAALGTGGARTSSVSSRYPITEPALKDALWQLIWSAMRPVTPSPRCARC
jgi:ATP-dependent Lhr-like helicase